MRLSVATAVACLMTTGLSVADQARAAIRKPTNIDAQGLAPALQLFARQRDIQLVYRSELIGDRKTGGAAGELTVEEALTQLLSGTGLAYQHLGENGITIVPVFGGGNSESSESSSKRSFLDRFRVAQSETSPGLQPPSARGGQGRGEEAENTALDSSKDSDQQTIDEIIVTAQKRDERLQDVPISISVLRGGDLDKSTSEGITESLNRVPGVAAMPYSLQGGGTTVTVRGVAAGGPLFNGSNPVAYYLDSVPFGFVKSAIAPDANAYDLERVEALRGPQGTLYGASALNGVVRVLTHDADLNEFGFKARTSASSTEGGGGNYRGDMAVNVPIAPGKLAVRAIAGYQNLSGWIDRPDRKDSNDAEISNLRLKINAQPTEELSLSVFAWQSRTDNGAPSMGNDSERRGALLDESIATDYDAYGLKVGYDFARVSVVSMTSYLDYKNDSAIDLRDAGLEGLLLSTGVSSHVFSQEVILNSTNNGAWRWTVGASYRSAEDRLIQDIPSLNPPFGINFGNGSEASALFGELSRRFLDDQFEWTLGLRYFEDDVYARQNALNAGQADQPLYHATDSFDSTTPRAVLTWYPNSDLTVYASYAEGFRSGALQDPGIPFPSSLHPDSLKNYEIGAKGRLWGGRIQLDTALYYMDWQDVQQSLTVPYGVTIVTALVNGDSASGIGVDFGVTAQLLDGLELEITVGWNDLAMDTPVSIPNGGVLFNKGDRLNLSPEYTAGASADYVFSIGRNGFEGRLSASANYTSEQSLRTIVGGVQQSISTGDPMLIARTSFSIRAPEHWEVTLFADNVNNEGGTIVGSPFVGSPIPDWDARVRPRTLGVQLDYRFQ